MASEEDWTGQELAGQEEQELAGQEGQELAGQEGQELEGQEEQERTGQEQTRQAGQEQAGQEQAGQEQAGQEQAGQEQAGQEQAGHSTPLPAASTSHMLHITPLVPSEDVECPICQEPILSEAFVSVCWHSYCFLCILEWSCRNAVCPLCRRPFQLLFLRVGSILYEVHNISAYRRDRARLRALERRQLFFSGHHYRRVTRIDGGGYDGTLQRVRSRSPDDGTLQRVRSRSPGWHLNGLAEARGRIRSRSPRRHRDGQGRAGSGGSSSRQHARSPARSRSRRSGRRGQRDRGPALSLERGARASSRRRRHRRGRSRSRDGPRSRAGHGAW
ncbi:E3 ubiquitin-protein ligase RNF8-like [Apus apus]|uniref:E3 ubiquitin-protein ligase RNF8-like n=1 Tax=Apus apus TaxID=8895 RepID=UPI0021F83276|nr:E3 ubiquitin-protein ligase RNF8-like [Apus apus]